VQTNYGPINAVVDRGGPETSHQPTSANLKPGLAIGWYNSKWSWIGTTEASNIKHKSYHHWNF